MSIPCCSGKAQNENFQAPEYTMMLIIANLAASKNFDFYCRSRFIAMGITEVYFVFSNDTQDTTSWKTMAHGQQGFWQTPEGSGIDICKVLLDTQVVLLLGL